MAKTTQQLIAKAMGEEERATLRFEQHFRNAMRAFNDMRASRKKIDRLAKRAVMEDDVAAPLRATAKDIQATVLTNMQMLAEGKL